MIKSNSVSKKICAVQIDLTKPFLLGDIPQQYQKRINAALERMKIRIDTKVVSYQNGELIVELKAANDPRITAGILFCLELLVQTNYPPKKRKRMIQDENPNPVIKEILHKLSLMCGEDNVEEYILARCKEALDLNKQETGLNYLTLFLRMNTVDNCGPLPLKKLILLQKLNKHKACRLYARHLINTSQNEDAKNLYRAFYILATTQMNDSLNENEFIPFLKEYQIFISRFNQLDAFSLEDIPRFKRLFIDSLAKLVSINAEAIIMRDCPKTVLECSIECLNGYDELEGQTDLNKNDVRSEKRALYQSLIRLIELKKVQPIAPLMHLIIENYDFIDSDNILRFFYGLQHQSLCDKELKTGLEFMTDYLGKCKDEGIQEKLLRTGIRWLHTEEVNPQIFSEFSEIVHPYRHLLNQKDIVILGMGLDKQNVNESTIEALVRDWIEITPKDKSDHLVALADWAPKQELASMALYKANHSEITTDMLKVLTHCLVKHNLNDTLLRQFTKMHSIQDQLYELLTLQMESSETREEDKSYFKACRLVLSSLCKDTSLDISEMIECITVFSPETDTSLMWQWHQNGDETRLKEAVFTQLFHVEWSACKEWVGVETEYDEKDHFKSLTTKCANGETHTLHVQNHSAPHIEGYTANVRYTATGDGDEKTRFKEALLSSNNFNLLLRCWETFDPDEYSRRTDGNKYWRVSCGEDIGSGRKPNTIFTIQVSMIGPTTYSVHIHPSSGTEWDSEITI